MNNTSTLNRRLKTSTQIGVVRAARKIVATAATLAGLSTATGALVALTPSTAAADPGEQIAGSAFYEDANDPKVCLGPPSGYEDFDSYPALVPSGSLNGCWYTKVVTARSAQSGVYLESGEELFVGTLNGGPVGTFTTTYKFEAKLAPDGTEIRGRCQHPIVSGTGGFAGATGIILFKDAPPVYFYRGHIKV